MLTEDSRFVIFKIRPFFKDTRDARIKKKKLDDFPKDSLAIVELGKDSVWKRSRIKSYNTPEKSFGWVAYQLEKPLADTSKSKRPEANTNKTIDSLKKVIDSLKYLNQQLLANKNTNKDKATKKDDESIFDFADEDPATAGADAGTDLILRKLGTSDEKVFKNILYYNFNKTGTKLLLNVSRNPKDSLSKTLVVLYDIQKSKTDTLSRGGNDFKNFAMPDEGVQVAYVAERDSSAKALQKFYKLWYFKEGMDSAKMIADKNSPGVKKGWTISENGNLNFSKSGKRLFFGTAEIQPPKDTITPDIDKVSIDIWNYKDDYLQSTQLNRLQTDLKRNYLAVYDLGKNSILQLETEAFPTVIQTNEGDGERFIGLSDTGRRVESQWTGRIKRDLYSINVNDGTKKLVLKNAFIFTTPQWQSPNGKYFLWYDMVAKNYFVYNGDSIRNITSKINLPLWNEENDVPDLPPPYGVMKWFNKDNAVYIYDRYDVWKVDPAGKLKPVLVTNGRKDKIVSRYTNVDPDEKFISDEGKIVYRLFDETTKKSQLSNIFLGSFSKGKRYQWCDCAVNNFLKSKDSNIWIFSEESFSQSQGLYSNFSVDTISISDNLDFDAIVNTIQLTSTNPQQSQYNWGTAELFKWKTYNGKESQGIVYKPEDFDPKKKYPMICYFYETLSDGLYSYQAPSPTPSRLNIPFFVSRGYVVFVPDIHYGTGHPGRDAYNYIVSGARAVVKKGFVDSTRIGIQGQSWGGYQVAYLITATNFFKAAWAGAPVVNMTSAYGGIRWESGLNRQFQYEKSQSRIGASLWEKPELYIENSPLFHLPKVKTPLVIMSNDADGAVPWYQGIEFFTAMRRLGKPVWLLVYNGEAHNLVERKNRKDIQIREQQYFDWLLKDAKPPKWITEGVPAVKKGKDWGLEIDE